MRQYSDFIIIIQSDEKGNDETIDCTDLSAFIGDKTEENYDQIDNLNVASDEISKIPVSNIVEDATISIADELHEDNTKFKEVEQSSNKSDFNISEPFSGDNFFKEPEVL